MPHLFWLSGRQLEKFQPFFPKSPKSPKSRGVSRVNDRKVLRGMVYVLCCGLMHRLLMEPHTTLYKTEFWIRRPEGNDRGLAWGFGKPDGKGKEMRKYQVGEP